jgi:hypothetical protein
VPIWQHLFHPNMAEITSITQYFNWTMKVLFGIMCECNIRIAAVFSQLFWHDTFFPMIMLMTAWGYWRNNDCQRKTKLLGDKQSPLCPVHHKSQLACPDTEPGPVRRRTVACTRAAMNLRQDELYKQSTGLGEQRCAQRSNYSDERAI